MQTSQDLLLAKFALKTGLVSQEVLQDCLREQQEGSSRGMRPALIQVLVKRRLVSADGLLPITHAIESTSFDCMRCRVRHPFTAVAGTALACPVCGSAVTIVQQDGDQISERLRTGRAGGTQRVKTRADGSGGSARFEREARQTVVTEPTIKSFGPYEILAEVGRGGMGIVYKARHPQLDKVVALKVLIAGVLASKTQVKRFQREAELAGKLRHPAIVAIHDVGAIDDRPYFTMDFVEGTVLEDRLKTRDLPLRQGVEIARDLARALAHAHENGVIHRDVKPANIIIDSDGRPHLTDFGLAREAKVEDSARLTRDGAAVGTPYYMSPEQARGEGAATGPLTDVYSLGVVLFEMLTFERPFNAKGQVELTQKILMEPAPRPTEIEPAIDRELEAVVLKVLEKNPRDRYPSADAFADDLDRYLRGEKIKGARPVKKKAPGSVRIVALVLAAAGLLGAGFGLWQIHLKQVQADLDAALAAQRATAQKLLEERKRKTKQALDDAEKAWTDADRILPTTASEAFFEKIRVTIERATDCIQLEPGTARAYLLRARAEELARKKDLAQKDYEKAQDLEPKGPSGTEAAYRLASLLLRTRRDESFKSRMMTIAGGDGPEVWRHLARVASQLQERDARFDEVLPEVEAAKRADPTNAEAYYVLAVTYATDGRKDRTKDALEALEESLRLEPKSPRAYVFRATVKFQADQIDEAEEDTRRALALDPDDIPALNLQAHIDVAKENYAQAAESMRRILALEAGHEEVDALVAAVQIYCLADDLSSAERAAARAIELAPEQPDAALKLAQGSVRLGHADRAEKVLRDALARCTAPPSQNLLAQEYLDLLLAAGTIDQAVAFAQSYLDQQPDNVQRILRLASLLDLRAQPGDREKALAMVTPLEQKTVVLASVYELHFRILADLGKSKELDDTIAALQKTAGNTASLWIAIAVAYHSLDRKAETTVAAKKAVDLEPNNPEANTLLAQIELSEGQLADATRHARAALAVNRANAKALVVLGGAALKQQGPGAEAFRYLDQALRVDPANSQAVYLIALMLHEDGKSKDAVALIERFLATGHGNDASGLWGVLGVANTEIGKYDRAEQALRHALELDKNDADAHAALANVLLKRGRTAEATAEVNEALRIEPGNPNALKVKSRLP
jgi:tetratricopeptide (TPR) repeat protein/tRNA A-37 threonylcarbamoyl transferase component Bud32